MTIHIVGVVVLTIICIGVNGESIDNQLLDIPQIKCGPDVISVNGITEKPFEGVVYIKGWRRKNACFVQFENQFTRTPSFNVSLTELSRCGMEMKRMPNTKEIEIQGVWVFSFHPKFVTKVDRAYDIHCIFRQRDVTVTSGLSINMITTRDTIRAIADMPNIEMKVVDVRDSDVRLARPVTEVRVGDQLKFIWYTPSSSDMYGIVVKDCYVQHIAGTKVQLIEDGCSLDSITMSELEYNDEMTEAKANVMAFKFADRSDLWFQCTVSLCMKSDSTSTADDSCLLMKPTCSKRRKRATFGVVVDHAVVPNKNEALAQLKLLVLDYYNQKEVTDQVIQDQKDKKILFYRPAMRFNNGTTQIKKDTQMYKFKPKWSFCMRKSVFAIVTSVLMLMYIATFILGAIAVVVYCRRKPSGNSPNSIVDNFCDSLRLGR